MDNSTEGVTLLAAFVNDVLKNYEDKRQDYQGLFDLTKGHDLSKPTILVPMKLYNDACGWIETNLGKFNLIRIGRNVGETAYEVMLTNRMIDDKSTPLDVIKALVLVAQTAIQDPKQRGWKIMGHTSKSISLRRTQTFNSKLQLGLLDGLVRKSGATGVRVEFTKEIELGSEFDEYIIHWI